MDKRNYEAIDKFDLSQAMVYIYKNLYEAYPNLYDANFSLLLLRDEDDICMNITAKIMLNNTTREKWRTYRIDEDGNIITWVEEYRESNGEKDDEKRELLQESADNISKTMLALDTPNLLARIKGKDADYTLHVSLEKETDDEE